MKLFIGNLSWNATEDALRPLFEAFGQVVSVKIIFDPYTGRSKGFGFVEMGDQAAAEAAIAGLNETDFLDRPLRVSLARQDTGGGFRSGPRTGGPGGAPRGGNRSHGGGGGFGRGSYSGSRDNYEYE